jgi:putative cardiolipin synthase
MGLLIESPALAEWLARGFDDAVPNVAYEVHLGADGRGLEWIEQTRSGGTRYATEPATGTVRRAMVNLLSVLPIEWML